MLPRRFARVPLLAASLVATATAGCAKPPSFTGTYAGTWGTVALNQDGDRVVGRYPRGRLLCRALDRALDCEWEQGPASGRAHFVRGEHGTLEGTWGRDRSESDGGVWLLSKM